VVAVVVVAGGGTLVSVGLLEVTGGRASWAVASENDQKMKRPLSKATRDASTCNMCAAILLARVPPSNGGCPASKWYSVQPRL
jgi:hypothetical protein